MKYLTLRCIALCYAMLFLLQHLPAQLIYADQLISYTSCGAPCSFGVLNPGSASDADPATLCEMRNNLGVGNDVSLRTGFSAAAAPEALVGIPLQKAGLLGDLSLLGVISVELLDPSGNIIMQKTGLSATDLNVLNASQDLYSVSIVTPPGSYTIAGVRITMGGLLNLVSQVYVGDPFYINAASGCGLQYADAVTGSGTTGVCLLCSVSSAANVTDANLSNYAGMSVPVGVGGRTYIEVSFPTAGNTGDFAGFIIGDGSGLLDISLLGNIDISTYNGATPVENYTVSSLLGLALLSGGSTSTLVGFNATAPFNRLRISMGALASVLATMRVYGAVKYDPTPPLVSLSVSPDTVFCAGTAAGITATAGYTSYIWNTGATGQVLNPSASGRYMVGAYDAQGCPFYSAPLSLNVLALPALPAIQAADINCIGGNALIRAYPALSSLNYQLRIPAGASVGASLAGNDDTLRLFSDPVLTNTLYTVEVTDPLSGCQDEVAVPVTVMVPASPASVFSMNDQAGCWVKPADRFVHFLHPGTDRVIASLNPGSNDLGWVEISGYKETAVPLVQACNTTEPQFLSAVLPRHWHIQASGTPATDVKLRLYMDDSDYTSLAAQANFNLNPSDDVSSVTDLKLSKYSGTAENNTFADNCGTGTITLHLPQENGALTSALAGFDIAAGSFAGFSIPGFSELWLSGAGNSPLPVTISDWKVSCAGSAAVSVSWQSLSEVNNAFFIIESSVAGETWTEQYRLPGALNSNEPLFYDLSALHLPAGHRYLRLVQEDLNGERTVKTSSYLPCQAPGSGAGILRAYPNPASEYLTIEGLPETGDKLWYLLMDAGGRVLRKGQLGYSSVQVPLGELAPGFYILRTGKDLTEVFRFQKR